MEQAQRASIHNYEKDKCICLNPYFNGTCSKSQQNVSMLQRYMVLILILMEHAQRDQPTFTNKSYKNMES